MATQILTPHPLLLINLFSIYLKLKDLLKNPIPCLLQSIPKVDTKSIYKTSWVQPTFNSQFNVRIVGDHQFMKNVVCLIEEVLINSLLKNSVICILDQFKLLLNPFAKKGINAFVLMCLRDARFKDFRTSILGMINSSLFDGPCFWKQ